MTRELRKVLDKIDICILHKRGLQLNLQELKLLKKYIKDLIKAIVDGVDEINN